MREVPGREADETRAFYELAAEALAQRWADRSVMKPFLDRFASLLDHSACVLDLGCGPGHDSHELAARGLRVMGLDFAVATLRAGHLRYPAIDFIAQDLQHLALRSESVDGIWASASLLHIPRLRQPATLAEVRRVLKPGGILYTSMQAGRGQALVEGSEYGTQLRRLYVYYSPQQWERLLKEAGFEILSLETDYGRHLSLDPGGIGWISAFARRL